MIKLLKIELPLLITSYINAEHSSTVNLKDSSTRLSLTLLAITEWLIQNPTLPIVICDGSNNDQSDLIQKQFPNANIEWICFQNNHELVEKYGKGYGEGEIIAYALENSTLLKKYPAFIKCTGKLWVKNYLPLTRKFNGNFLAKGYFKNVISLRKTNFEYIDTRFFISSKKFFYEHIFSAYQKSKAYSIESSLKDELTSKNMKHYLINEPIEIEGVGGGTGTAYKNNLKRYLKERLRNFLLNRSRYKHLFINQT